MREHHLAIDRRSVLAGSATFVGAGDVNIRPLPARARFVLRLGGDGLQSVGQCGGLALTMPINRVSSVLPRMAARLGPDEWLLLTSQEDASAFEADASRALAGHHHALVDIGHRQVAFEISGGAAANVLNAGCPLDLGQHRFSVGKASRTLFGKAEVILFRLADMAEPQGGLSPRFHLECWRSFGPYVHDLLKEAAREYSDR